MMMRKAVTTETSPSTTSTAMRSLWWSTPPRRKSTTTTDSAAPTRPPPARIPTLLRGEPSSTARDRVRTTDVVIVQGRREVDAVAVPRLRRATEDDHVTITAAEGASQQDQDQEVGADIAAAETAVGTDDSVEKLSLVDLNQKNATQRKNLEV